MKSVHIGIDCDIDECVAIYDNGSSIHLCQADIPASFMLSESGALGENRTLFIYYTPHQEESERIEMDSGVIRCGVHSRRLFEVTCNGNDLALITKAIESYAGSSSLVRNEGNKMCARAVLLAWQDYLANPSRPTLKYDDVAPSLSHDVARRLLEARTRWKEHGRDWSAGDIADRALWFYLEVVEKSADSKGVEVLLSDDPTYDGIQPRKYQRAPWG